MLDRPGRRESYTRAAVAEEKAAAEQTAATGPAVAGMMVAAAAGTLDVAAAAAGTLDVAAAAAARIPVVAAVVCTLRAACTVVVSGHRNLASKSAGGKQDGLPVPTQSQEPPERGLHMQPLRGPHSSLGVRGQANLRRLSVVRRWGSPAYPLR